jgi:hypothetical protein
MHVLAHSYGWGEESLWAMPAKRRRLWAKMVRIQRLAESGAFEGEAGGYPPPQKNRYRESE